MLQTLSSMQPKLLKLVLQKLLRELSPAWYRGSLWSRGTDKYIQIRVNAKQSHLACAHSVAGLC